MLLLVKLLALGSALGGPLVMMDRYAPVRGHVPTFLLMFAPTLLILVAVLFENDDDRWQRITKRAGQVGATLLLMQNALASWLIASDQTPEPENRGLYITGIVIGVATALLYLRRSIKAPEPFDFAREVARAERRAKYRDYGLLAVSTVMIATGLFAMSEKPGLGIMVVSFFGACSLVPIFNIRRKRRASRVAREGSLQAIALPEDRTIRPSRGRLLAIEIGVFALCTLMVFVAEDALLVRVLAGGVALALAFAAVMTAAGKLPAAYLRFDEKCLTLGKRGYEMHVPWATIDLVLESEYFDNATVTLEFDDLEDVTTTPPECRERAHAALRKQQAWTGSPVVLMAVHYGVHADELMLTLELARIAAVEREPAASTP